tara:strand:- start:1224 stop:1904 length:681 start_codon:yes stop_codon:yes gene_type:complete
MADGDDWGQIGAGAGTGALSGAGTGATVGAYAMAPVPVLIPVGALIGAIIGGVGGAIAGGISAHAANLADDIPRSEGGGKCPEGYVYNPATKACQPTGSTAKAVSTARGIKDKEGKSIFDEAAKKLVTKKPEAGDAATAATAKPPKPSAPKSDTKAVKERARMSDAGSRAAGKESLQDWSSRQSFGGKKKAVWGDQALSEAQKWLLEREEESEKEKEKYYTGPDKT